MSIATNKWNLGGAILLLPVIACAAAPTLIYGNVSGWAIHTEPSSGFTCFAEVGYEGGSWLRIGYVQGDASTFLTVSEPGWKASGDSATASVEVAFDESDPLAFTSASFGFENAVSIRIAEDQSASFFELFSNSYSMAVSVDNGVPVVLSLGGSMNAVGMLRECQSSMKQYSGS